MFTKTFVAALTNVGTVKPTHAAVLIDAVLGASDGMTCRDETSSYFEKLFYFA